VRRTALLVLVVLRPSLVAADCDDPFARPADLLDMHVRLKRADWTQLLADTVPDTNDPAKVTPEACAADYPRYPAEFRCGDQPWIAVSVAKKRGTERGVEVPSKPPLKIDFKKAGWPALMGKPGYGAIALNNGQMNRPPASVAPRFLDPVLLDEYAALRLLGHELPISPGVAYARLTVHFDDAPAGEYHGAYLVIEELDRASIQRRLGAARAEGRLLKKTNPNCPVTVKYDDGPPNAAQAAFDAWSAKDPADFPGTWRAETEKGIALDTFLRQEAIREVVLNGYDTITFQATGTGNNYYAFEPRAGSPRQYIPWDLDQAFGGLYGFCGAGAYFACPPEKPVLDHCAPGTMNPASSEGKRTVCQPGIRERYLEIMCQLVNGSLSPGAFERLWDEADRTVRPAVMDEAQLWQEPFPQPVAPRAPPDGGTDPLDERVFRSYASEYARMKPWMRRRTEFVRAEIERLGVSCPDRPMETSSVSDAGATADASDGGGCGCDLGRRARPRGVVLVLALAALALRARTSRSGTPRAARDRRRPATR
jgi:hypothetical protein